MWIRLAEMSFPANTAWLMSALASCTASRLASSSVASSEPSKSTTATVSETTWK
jgi:hypothetical protein